MSREAALTEWLEGRWAQQAQSFKVIIDDAAIAYRGWNITAQSDPGLILVHGFGAHSRWWDHIAPSLADRHRVVALDLSGMGDSDRRAAYSRMQNAQEILGVADACGFDSFTLITHSFGSMGGILASNIAPRRIYRHIIIDAGIPTGDERNHQVPSFAPRFYPDRESAIQRFRLTPTTKLPVVAIADYIAKHSVVEAEEGWTWKFDPGAPLSLNKERYREALFGVTVPTDIVYGEQTNVMTADRIAALLKAAPLAGKPVKIPTSGHHVMVDQPLALIAALEAFLANPPIGRGVSY